VILPLKISLVYNQLQSQCIDCYYKPKVFLVKNFEELRLF
jgi:hypothetical protein